MISRRNAKKEKKKTIKEREMQIQRVAIDIQSM